MIVFAWEGFPQYAARCVGALVMATDEPVFVVATRPKVPIEGMECVSGCPVRWIDAAELDVAGVLPGPVAEGTSLFVSGWSIPAFNRLADAVRAVGGRVVCMNDANFIRYGFRARLEQALRALRFRLRFRGAFDAFFVPGASGRRLMRFFGVSDDRIVEGLYSADDSLFGGGVAPSARGKRVVYVGQFCARKNVLAMCRAFAAAGGAAAGWRLDLYGSGPLRADLERMATDGSVVVHDFVQPERLAEVYRGARAFCLASVEEHWGLVVHEAALSGCVLLLGESVGSREDFEGRGNVLAFDSLDEGAIADAFRQLFALSGAELDAAGNESRRMGRSGASVSRFVTGVLAALRG